MIIRVLKPEEWDGLRFSLLRFMRKYGDKRLSPSVWLRLVRLRPGGLSVPGTAMAVAFTAGGQPGGAAFAVRYGEETCAVVVHPALLGRGVYVGLLVALSAEWDRPEPEAAEEKPDSEAAWRFLHGGEPDGSAGARHSDALLERP